MVSKLSATSMAFSVLVPPFGTIALIAAIIALCPVLPVRGISIIALLENDTSAILSSTDVFCVKKLFTKAMAASLAYVIGLLPLSSSKFIDPDLSIIKTTSCG